MNVVIYSRVSSQSARQSTERQVVDLEVRSRTGGTRWQRSLRKKISGRKANIERPVLSRCLEYCTDPQNRVDMLLLTEISRLGRSTWRSKVTDTLHTHKICVYSNLNLETLRPDKTVKPLVLSDHYPVGELAAIERQGIIDRLNSGRELYIQKGAGWDGSREAGNGRTEERGIPGGDRLVKERLPDPERGEAHGKGHSTIQQVKKRLH